MINFPLIGNVNLRDSVVNALASRRMPHAMLIEGDVGTGRHTLANFIAKALVCEGNSVPCGECKNCLLAESLNHPDITVTAPEENKKNIAVAQIRALKESTAIKPHVAKSKVFVIDSADTMNDQSQNALLKVLEEPPEATYFILIAESKASFLETVISRCVVLTLSTAEKQAAVEYIEQNFQYNINDIEQALEVEKNNIGKALLVLEGKSNSQIAVCAKEFLQGLFSNDAWCMLKATASAEKNRIEADKFFKELKLCTAKELRNNPSSYKAKMLTKLYDELGLLEKSLVTNINLGLLFSTLVSRAIQIK